MGKVTRDAVVGRWTPEGGEGESDTRTYRPLPPGPSRPRASIELKADGTMILAEIGPTDRLVRRPGTWELGPGGRLVLRPNEGPERVHEILSVAADRLVVRK